MLLFVFVLAFASVSIDEMRRMHANFHRISPHKKQEMMSSEGFKMIDIF